MPSRSSAAAGHVGPEPAGGAGARPGDERPARSPTAHRTDQPRRLGAAPQPPAERPDAERRRPTSSSRADPAQRSPAREPGTTSAFQIPPSAERRERRRQRALAVQGEHRARRARVAVAGVQQPGDQPGRVARPGTAATQQRSRRRAGPASAPHDEQHRPPRHSPALALRLPSGSSSQQAVGRLARRARSRRPARTSHGQHGVPEQHRPVARSRAARRRRGSRRRR